MCDARPVDPGVVIATLLAVTTLVAAVAWARRGQALDRARTDNERLRQETAATSRARAERDADRVALLDALDEGYVRVDGGDRIVEADAQAEIASLQDQVLRAITAGDLADARARLGALRALVDVLDQAYELRVVSRPGEQSGVWRTAVDRPGTRNHYVIVEAIGRDGRPLSLPITSEEDQQTRQVQRFGLRVSEAVYERVKADKLDNGIVDQNLFGQKRRGARRPEYRFATTGGAITQW